LKDYEHGKLNRDTEIEAKTEDDRFICKTFRCLVECPVDERQRYDYDYLMDFCDAYGLQLLKDYEHEKINRDTIIYAMCTECDDVMIPKTFRDLVKNQNTGCLEHHEVFKQKKFMNTCQTIYGVDNPSQSDIVQEMCLKKYGVRFAIQSKEAQDKSRATCLKTYGCEYARQSKEVQLLSQETCLKKYGVRFASQTKEAQDKSRETCLIKYGVPYPMQNAEIFEKAQRSRYATKKYLFPSGRIDLVQGYEPFALHDLLFKEHVHEDAIFTKRTQVPEIWYNDEDGKEHRYYVDIFIPDQKRCIEVKSQYTFDKDKDIVLLKQQAVIEAGYTCDIWIYNYKKELIQMC